MLKDLYEFKKDLGNRGIFFCLSGPISQNLVAEIGSTLEQKMSLEETSKSTVLRVFSTVVENAQNIMRYSDEKEEKLSLGIIAVGYEGSHYFVLCGNMVENDKIEGLRKKLTKLQTMNKNELKEYYRKQRREGPPKESRGAGLGFIDMAKKASKPIEFDFKKIDEEVSFFSMRTVI
ncbi:SiaB family protein kinase [Desulfobacterales bacterium HSG2]|nr:SiaB family protein kinase [Desulfobacterales bacterium HSG2]